MPIPKKSGTSDTKKKPAQAPQKKAAQVNAFTLESFRASLKSRLKWHRNMFNEDSHVIFMQMESWPSKENAIGNSRHASNLRWGLFTPEFCRDDISSPRSGRRLWPVQFKQSTLSRQLQDEKSIYLPYPSIPLCPSQHSRMVPYVSCLLDVGTWLEL